MNSITLFARSSILIGMLSALAACGDIDSSRDFGADEVVEVIESDEVVESAASAIIDDNGFNSDTDTRAALNEEALPSDHAAALSSESDELVSAKLNERGVFVDVSTDDAARLASEEDADFDDTNGLDSNKAKATTGCDAAVGAGTTNYAVGDSCSMCKQYTWICGGNRRKYFGTVVQRPDGLYCEGNGFQLPSCC